MDLIHEHKTFSCLRGYREHIWFLVKFSISGKRKIWDKSMTLHSSTHNIIHGPQNCEILSLIWRFVLKQSVFQCWSSQFSRLVLRIAHWKNNKHTENDQRISSPPLALTNAYLNGADKWNCAFIDHFRCVFVTLNSSSFYYFSDAIQVICFLFHLNQLYSIYT